jgi:cytochrome P450 family 9
MGIQKIDMWTTMKILLFVTFRKIYVLLKLQLTRKEVYDFFYNAIVKVMKEREQKGIFRPDVIQLLMQAKKGQLESQDKEHEVNEAELSNFSANIEYDVKAKNKKLTNWTDEHFMAQGFIFFAAGFDTTNVLLQVTAYSLAKNKDVEQKLIDEVDEVIATLEGGQVTYDALHKMKYLDMVICEALRMWSPAALTNRECSKDYNLKLSDGNTLKLRSGDILNIPIYSIHHDPKYFEDPDKFDPERFSDERKGSIADGSYIPFGYGPRVSTTYRLNHF